MSSQTHTSSNIEILTNMYLTQHGGPYKCISPPTRKFAQTHPTQRSIQPHTSSNTVIEIHDDCEDYIAYPCTECDLQFPNQAILALRCISNQFTCVNQIYLVQNSFEDNCSQLCSFALTDGHHCYHVKSGCSCENTRSLSNVRAELRTV